MKRSELREHIFKILFGIEFRDGAEFSEQIGTYTEEMEGAGPQELEYVKRSKRRSLRLTNYSIPIPRDGKPAV